MKTIRNLMVGGVALAALATASPVQAFAGPAPADQDTNPGVAYRVAPPTDGGTGGETQDFLCKIFKIGCNS